MKFGRPARSITVTLPDDVVGALRARNRDIGRAIVALLAAESANAPIPPSVVLHQTGNRAVIVVRPVDALSRLPGVQLVSLGDPDRSLIAFTAGMTVAAFELQVQDLLDGASLEETDAGGDRATGGAAARGPTQAGANVVRGDDHCAGRCDPTGAARPRSRVARPRPHEHSLATDTLPRYGHVEECRAGLAIRRRTVWDHARDSGDSLAHRYSEAGTTCHCARPGLRHLTTGHTPLAHYPEAGGERDSHLLASSSRETPGG